MKEPTIEHLRERLATLDRYHDELKARFPEEFARIYASEQYAQKTCEPESEVAQ